MEIINSYFEAPMFLLMIPALFFLIFIRKRSKKLLVSSVMLFRLAESQGYLKGILKNLVFILPKVLIVGGMCILILAIAEPRSQEFRTVERVERGRVAVMIDDISSSMAGENLIAMKNANLAFLDVFCRTDGNKEVLSRNLVGVVAFSNDADIRMTPTRDCAIIRRRIEALKVESSTAIEKGLWKGLALLIEWVDRGRLIPKEEFRRVSTSLYERQVRIPKNSGEFCRKYKGLSLLLFTDGEFYSGFDSREAVLRMTQNQTGTHDINPFNVIDLAKALCVRTYFWSMGNLPKAYKEAFSNPPGSGFAIQISGMNKKNLAKSYADVAEKESGEIITEKILEFNPLKRHFIAAGLVCFLLGLLIFWSKNYSHHAGKE